MKSVSIILALGLVAGAVAQDACVGVAAKIPSCAVSTSLNLAHQHPMLIHI